MIGCWSASPHQVLTFVLWASGSVCCCREYSWQEQRDRVRFQLGRVTGRARERLFNTWSQRVGWGRCIAAGIASILHHPSDRYQRSGESRSVAEPPDAIFRTGYSSEEERRPFSVIVRELRASLGHKTTHILTAQPTSNNLVTGKGKHTL